jgi:hypothetical protein
LAVGVFVGLVAGAAQADDVGIVRISDHRPRQVVRGQSPDEAAAETPDGGIVRTQCAAEPGTCPAPGCNNGAACPIGSGPPYGCPSSGGCRLFDGLAGGCPGGVRGDNGCPAHGGIYNPNCPDCRLIGGKPVGDVYCPDGRWVQCPDGHWDWYPNHEPIGLWEGLFGSCGDFWGDFFRNRRDAYKIGCFNHPETPLFGCYDIVYPVDPFYFDKRDGQVYAAQGVGGPVSVPLAPMVRHTYNYGWGVPSSRLTPISHPVPLTTARKK